MKEHYAKKDVDNNAASKLSPAAEESLNAARDSKATYTSYGHAIIPGETHPLMDKEFNKKLEADAKKREEARKAAEKAAAEKKAKEKAAKGEEGKGEEKKGEEKKGEEKKEEAPPADAAIKIKSSKGTQSAVQKSS